MKYDIKINKNFHTAIIFLAMKYEDDVIMTIICDALTPFKVFKNISRVKGKTEETA